MWRVTFKSGVSKAIGKLPAGVVRALDLLVDDLQAGGPVRGDWPNYGKLANFRHHCHLKKGRPTYVAVWEVIAEARLIRIVYVGTHEKAPY